MKRILRRLWPVARLLAWLLPAGCLAATAAPTKAQTFSVLYAFTGGADGSEPAAGVMLDARGNLYGTAYEGGVNNAGVVFEIAAGGAPGLKSIAVKSNPLRGGMSATGTILLTRPTPPGHAVILSLSSSDPTVVSVPHKVIVRVGQQKASFTVRTSSVSKTMTVKISAVYAVTIKTTMLKVMK